MKLLTAAVLWGNLERLISSTNRTLSDRTLSIWTNHNKSFQLKTLSSERLWTCTGICSRMMTVALRRDVHIHQKQTRCWGFSDKLQPWIWRTCERCLEQGHLRCHKALRFSIYTKWITVLSTWLVRRELNKPAPPSRLAVCFILTYVWETVIHVLEREEVISAHCGLVKMEKVINSHGEYFPPSNILSVSVCVERADSADIMMSVWHAGHERRSRTAAGYTVIHL